MKASSTETLKLMCMLWMKSEAKGGSWVYKPWVWRTIAESTSLAVKCKSWISMKGAKVLMNRRELQRQNRKEEFPDPTRQVKPTLRTILAWIIEDQVGESLEREDARTILEPTPKRKVACIRRCLYKLQYSNSLLLSYFVVKLLHVISIRFF